MKKKQQGPVEMLCQEIGATFTKNMETTQVLTAFVSVLVCEIESMVQSEKHIAHLTGKEVPVETDNAIECVKKLLTIKGREELIDEATICHNNELWMPDEGPCNHYIDMLSSCVSAIRFGLEEPCRSRHAASASNHVWKHRYGVSLFDRYTSSWGNQWASSKFYEALGQALPKEK